MLPFLAFVALQQADQNSAQAIPDLNAKILAFCKAHMGSQVGSGECADLAMGAVGTFGVHRLSKDDPQPGDYVWGKRIHWFDASDGQSIKQMTAMSRKDVKPGDIAQFRDLTIYTRSNGSSWRYSFPHHTAVIAAVRDDGWEWDVYEQNAGNKRYVVMNTYRMRDMKSGYVIVYRSQG